MIFVDTNILIDIASGNREWAGWSRRALAASRSRGPLLINAVVYAEFAIAFDSQTDCDAEIDAFDLTLAEIPKSAAFRAAEAFKNYRRAGGAKNAVLPDFFIGAHASLLGISLLTRDARRYRTYFREVSLIAPEES